MRVAGADLHEDEIFILGRRRCIVEIHGVMIEHDDFEVRPGLSQLFARRAPAPKKTVFWGVQDSLLGVWSVVSRPICPGR